MYTVRVNSPWQRLCRPRSAPVRGGPAGWWGAAGGERGAAAVEFAVVAGLLVTMLLGMVELGLVLDAQLVVSMAAREAARQAAVDGGASTKAYQRAEETLRLGALDPGLAAVEIWPRQASYGTVVHARVSYPYTFLTHALEWVGGRGVELKTEAVTRSEKVR
ncbi:MAG: TadE/TadG family type IV pilus assembly protein [Bacillota bacterium]